MAKMTDEQIEASLKDWYAELDSDYDAQVTALADAFIEKDRKTRGEDTDDTDDE